MLTRFLATALLGTALLGTTLALAGCGRHLEFQDDFSGLFEETVQRPYAVGTTAQVTVQWSTLDRVTGWMAESDDPGVIRIDSQGVTPSGQTLQLTVRAIGAGDTHLTVKDGTRRVGSVSMRVVEATRLELLDHALQKTKRESQDVGDEVRVVVGQPMAVETRYLTDAGERAWGRDLVTWPEVADLGVWTDAETLGRDAEYLLVQPDDLGTFDLPLSLPGATQRTLRVVGVAEADIVRVEMLPPPEDDAEEGDFVCGGLLAYDAAGNRVFGAPADWSIDGESVGSGDLLCYTYAPGQPAASVTVQVGATGATLMVRGTGFHASSTAAIGCAVAGAAASGSAAGLVVGLLFLACALLLRRVLK